MRLERHFAVALGVMLGLAVCSAKTKMNPESTRELDLEMQKEIDVGYILDTSVPLQLSIPMVNRSNRTISISKVSKDCSCTSVSIDKLKLVPGEKATIRVVTNLSGKSNMFLSYIVVESDAVERVDEIQIRGQITGQIRIRPLRTTLVLGDQHAPGEFTVYCDDQNGKWRYAGFTADDPTLMAKITPKASSPTTSTYSGVVTINPDLVEQKPADYRVSMITLTFINDALHKSLELKYPVDNVIRRAVMADPPQVVFGLGTKDQKRSVLVQSTDPIAVDAVATESACLTASWHRIDSKTVLVQINYQPNSDRFAAAMPDLACHVISGGKVVGSIPVRLVDFR
jgi:hypothetical protein